MLSSQQYLTFFQRLLYIEDEIVVRNAHTKFNKLYTSSAVANYTRSLDPYRPVTAAIAVSVYSDRAVSFKRLYQNYIFYEELLCLGETS